MNCKYNVAFATGSRADYGIVRRYLKKLEQNPEINLEILVTGALLSKEYGRQVDLIYEDGFVNIIPVEVALDSTTNASVIHTMSEALDGFGKLFEERKYDLLIILGDRYEMLSIAVAAAMQRIPMLHIHGGEATYANYDEFIRHSITKMSSFHFTATEAYRRRVIQLGEDPGRVYYLGALGAENCLEIDCQNVPQDIIDFKSQRYVVVLFHPETISGADPAVQIDEVLKAMDSLSDFTVIFLGSNADTYSDRIRSAVKLYVERHDNAFYYENLHTDAYHYLVKNSICLIGNSSSGIIEAPSLETYTINIGDRQSGRVRGNSVIDVPCEAKKIVDSVLDIMKLKKSEITNPYYKPNAAQAYYETTLELLSDMKKTQSQPKVFFDISQMSINDG